MSYQSTNPANGEALQNPKEKTDRDLVTHERLPEKTKDLLNLKDRDEKTTGSEQAEIRKEIDDVADEV